MNIAKQFYPVHTNQLSPELLQSFLDISANINAGRDRIVVSVDGEIPGLLYFRVES